ncbi:asparagine synthase (glutamine-hydrolyzing) [Negadavirga shengliensis]|uniref:asparagine synthase (glutamine-hydrolyzing) n=1 Tax=Negadavirga shengliensis TaxID=1389218 RepID=A0ABV9SUU0_9BACT
MCGINLVLNARKGDIAIHRMMEATKHRGPDHSSWVGINEKVFIAGNRLKILDLRDVANQPLLSDDGKLALVWNGALYNYQELRNRLLERGEAFRSHSDGEVLLKWLGAFGSEGIKQLRGMFAIVFVDSNKKQVLLARDPVGMKPLYYYHRDHVLLCSSESKSILLSGLVSATVDRKQYAPYFYCRHGMPDASFFEDLLQVLPGEVKLYGFEGQHIASHQLEMEQHAEQTPTKEVFKELLTDAVLRQFHADVPVGVLLSGGADSSLLYQLWYKETGIPLHTYTVGFGKAYRDQYDDASFAAEVAGKYPGAHHEIQVDPQTVLEVWPEYVKTLDQPVGDSASILTWILAREANKQVKVLASGAGADELFGGYNRHKAFSHYLARPVFWNFLSRLNLEKIPLGREKRKFLASIHASPERTFMNFSALGNLPDSLATQLRPYYPRQLSDYKAALEWDRTFYLVNDVLKIHDNACMAHGIEGRAPYLDWSLVSLSRGMTEAEHLRRRNKIWIRELLREEGLGRVADRRKLGFGLPIREWIRDNKNFRETVFSEIGAFEKKHGNAFPPVMRKIAQNPVSYYKEGFLFVWNLFVLSSWIRENGL